MNEVQQWFSQYWRYVIGLVGVCIVAFFIFRAAVRSYKRYYTNYRKQESDIKRLLALKEKYKTLTEEVIQSAPDDELLEGVALKLQLELQKHDDMTTEFEKLSEEKKRLYALDVFVQDKSLKTFFRENGRELTEIIIPALEMIGLDEAAQKSERIRLMYDEKDETTSISEKIIEHTENYFETNDILTKIKLQAAKYIKDHSIDIIND